MARKTSPKVKRLSKAMTHSVKKLSESFPIKPPPPPPPPPPITVQKLAVLLRRRAKELKGVPVYTAKDLRILRTAVAETTFPPHKPPPPPPPPPISPQSVARYLETLAKSLKKYGGR
ncbi:MAG TPA: hypothetical protein VJN95_05995 [Gemmatimonadales bacterium]|nr:hypothetical protein [Gemmatimonadales bacterium]